MVNRCIILGCNSVAGRDEVSLFRIPTVITRQCDKTKDLSTRRRLLWVSRINRPDLVVTDNTRVCGRHFVSGKPSKLFEDENIDWAPSLRMGEENSEVNEGDSNILKRSTSSVINRGDWTMQEGTLDEAEEECDELEGEYDESEEEHDETEDECNGADVEHGETEEEHDKPEKEKNFGEYAAVSKENVSLTEDNIALRTENGVLRSKLCEFSEEQLAHNIAKVKFYTGLPTITLLKHVFDFVSVKINSSHRSVLSKFQEFMIVMMRLRLFLLEKDLAFRFGVSTPTVSNILDKWLTVMSIRMKGLIHWPDREDLRNTMPQYFKKAFGDKVAVIIDCFEIFIDRPSSLLTRAGTLSQYKHHNTVKFLIGITPQGTVSFISKAWVGRASDKCITESGGILDRLLPGDIVLADRGFNIEAAVGMYRAQLNIPAFTKGKAQLPSEEVQATREIANLRIHVKRVIGMLRRKFRILKGPLPVDMLSPRKGDTEAPIDHIVRVCCALVNLCPSIVPLTDKELEDMPYSDDMEL